ncbi:MAG: tRNA (guanosine(46)-N7)-methyltransferase TrmB [Mariniphaga sp.]|nr:tRNA (guanosine(46)-N7)-methyltransferase TrmB [Mariniphaga sp.]
MGKNKLKKFEEMKGFEQVVQAPFITTDNGDFYLKGKWGEKFFHNGNPIILELGCGKGEYTVEQAEKWPDKNFIGVDIKGARMWSGAKTSQNNGLKNVGFLRTNIEFIEQFFNTEEVEEIWLTFPDPQMGKTRKRLTSTHFLKKYQQILKKNGIIHLKTDSNYQYSYTSMLVHLNSFELLAKTNDLYKSEFLNDTLQIQTYYEKQWRSRGIPIKYLAFRLNNSTWEEPEIEFEKDDYRSFGRSARNRQP